MTALFAHGEDAGDHNQPLMVWYAAEPLVPLDMARALGLAAGSRSCRGSSPSPCSASRRSAREDALRVLTDRLGRTSDQAQRLDLVDGITQIVGKR